MTANTPPNTPPALGVERLEKLIDFIEKLPSEKWDFEILVSEFDDNHCGTVCCAMGWLPAVDPDNWSWKYDDDCDSLTLASKYGRVISNFHTTAYFDINVEVAQHLFFPHLQCTFMYGGKELDEAATIGEWVFNARIVLEKLKAGKI